MLLSASGSMGIDWNFNSAALMEVGSYNYTSNAFMPLSGAATTASEKRGIEALDSKGLIWMLSKHWIFSGPFFALWIINAAN